MKKRNLILLAPAAFLFTACCYVTKGEGCVSESSTTEVVQEIHNAENSLDYEGTYKGTMPAADCPGINITLNLLEDGTYSETNEYIERSTFEDKGTYHVEGNVLTAVSEKNDTSYYKVEENQLKKLNKEKAEVTGELAKYYILKKQ